MSSTPRIRIYVSPFLRAEMKAFEFGREVSWSAIAAKAFQAEMARVRGQAPITAPAPTPAAVNSPDVAAAVRNLADAAAHLARVLNPDRS